MSLPCYPLNDGAALPQVGFGTYPLKGEEGIAAMLTALEAGYRLLDSAVNYENEREVGEALRRSGLPREEVLVTTKVPGRFHQREKVIASVEDSLRTMQLERLDLVLIHWPNPRIGRYVEAFAALVECRERGLVRSVGVSNYTQAHLEEVIASTGVTPAVNQIELHPAFPQVDMVAAHQRLGIVTQSWSPIARMTSTPQLVSDLAEQYDVTPAQVILRWHLQRGLLPLPKSADPARQRTNLDLFSFALSAEEVAAVTALGRPEGRQWGFDPDSHEEM